MELVRKMQKNYDETLIREISNFLVDWLEEHVTGVDKKMFAELESKSL